MLVDDELPLDNRDLLGGLVHTGDFRCLQAASGAREVLGFEAVDDLLDRKRGLRCGAMSLLGRPAIGGSAGLGPLLRGIPEEGLIATREQLPEVCKLLLHRFGATSCMLRQLLDELSNPDMKTVVLVLEKKRDLSQNEGVLLRFQVDSQGTGTIPNTRQLRKTIGNKSGTYLSDLHPAAPRSETYGAGLKGK